MCQSQIDELCDPTVPCDQQWYSVMFNARSASGACPNPYFPKDPNEKLGPIGFGPEKIVGNTQPLQYAINFENVPDASAHAQRINVIDKLDQNLDWRTFRLREIGFGKYRITVPENRAFFQGRIQLGEDLGNLLADISAGLNIATGVVTWTLTAIDPNTGEQPNSALLGLLPPNDDKSSGQGFVTYTIQPLATAKTGTVIENYAEIIFDTEEPITTNTVTNTIDAEVPTSAVATLSASSPPTFTVSWAGDDIANGSGLQSYDIWVSENDGPYQPFLSGTTETSAPFTGQPGTTYRFYSIARDNAGNVEAAPTAPDAVTTVGDDQNPAPTLASLNPNSTAAGGPQFTLSVTGANFISGAMVHWNNAPRTTVYVSSTQLTATITATDIAAVGTANVAVVNPASGGTSNALTFTVTSAQGCAANIGEDVAVTRGGFRYNRASQRFVQVLTLINKSNSAFSAPVSLVLDGLSTNASLFGGSGTTSCALPAGSPYLNVDLGSDNVFSPGESVQVTLEFTNPTRQAINYSTRMLSGSEGR